MSSNYTAAVKHWGFSCPKGSKFYICENTWAEFIGCCTSNPCADGSGLCESGGVRSLSFDARRYEDLPTQGCLPSYDYYQCAWGKVPFVGCCSQNACAYSGCPLNQLGTSVLAQNELKRHDLLYPPSLNITAPSSSKTVLQPIPTLPLSSFEVPEYDVQSSRDVPLMRPETVAGICGAILVAALILLGVIAKYWKKSPPGCASKQAYTSIRNQDSDGADENTKFVHAPKRHQPITREVTVSSSPRKLKQTSFTTLIVWSWNIILTLVPMCFIALAIVVVDLDGQTESSYGQKVLELTRLSPSLYPILFAAIAGRFYKNFARYCLEQSGGVRLAVLEQLFGSQSFATAVERVFFVHTHTVLSVIILTTWALSPLGGQSSSRILGFGNATEVSNGIVTYLHPAYQVSSYLAQHSLVATKGSVAALYSSNLLSSLEQKRSARDMWELPKIPQVKEDMKIGETYAVDREALESGRDHYASLLGVKLRGFGASEEITEYNFTAQTSYISLDCSLVDDEIDRDSESWDQAMALAPTDEGAIIDIRSPLAWKDWNALHDPPPLQLLYFTEWRYKTSASEGWSFWSVTNCTMRTIWLETDIHCGPDPSATSCYAYQQRRLNDVTPANRLPKPMTKNFGALKQALGRWPEASADLGLNKPQATENYFMGELHPYAGQEYRNWTAMDRSIFPDQVSKRLTTAFNTFWDATLNPLGHTNVSFGPTGGNTVAYEDEFNSEPFMNSTVGTMTMTFEVYRASQLWVGILLTTTLFLQILAIVGLILDGLIVGPEVLGFASSLTRDNPYVPVPPGNSALGGPERARAFGDLRLQLADVEPGEENGYIAVHALRNSKVERVSGEDSEAQAGADGALGLSSTRPLSRERLYR